VNQYIAVLTPLYVTGFWALVFLVSPMKENRARSFLGFFMATAFLLYLGHSLFFLNKFDLYVHYDPVYIAATLLVYPMYYQYIRLLTVDTRWSVKYLLHYIPAFAMGLLGVILHHISHMSIHNDIEQYLRESYSLNFGKDNYLFWNSLFYLTHRILFALQIIIYFTMGLLFIRNHRERLVDLYSNHTSGSIAWVSNIFITLVIMAILSSVFNIIGKFNFLHHENSLLLPSMLFSATIFLMGYLANGQIQVIRDIVQADEKESEIPESKVTGQVELDVRLTRLFEIEKLHLNSDLKIWDVTARLGTNRTYLSNFINKNYAVNFSVFVNRYRVEDAKKFLANEEGTLYSLEVVGEKCGFGSYNNFIRVFREMEHVTPGRYRDLQKAGKIVIDGHL
jgi:AraC-like DNA-binding protein